MATVELVDLNEIDVPDKWRRLEKILTSHSWQVERITGSHHIFRKDGHGSIPVAFHGGSISRNYARLVLRQAGIMGMDYKVDDDDCASDLTILSHEVSQVSLSNNGAAQDNAKVVNIPASIQHSHITDHEREITRSKQNQRQIEDSAEILRRQTLLDRIQEKIASGKYTEAIKIIDDEKVDFVGNSDKKASFVLDIIFYKLVAYTEEAFETHEFNSKPQHECILATLRLANEYMEFSLERRNEVKDMTLALQAKFIQRYMVGISNYFGQYSVAFLGCKTLDNIINGVKSEEETQHYSREYAYAQMDAIVQIFRFIIDMYELVEKSSMAPVRELKRMESFLISSFAIDPCIRKMLISFDMEDFATVREILEMLTFAAKKFESDLDFMNVCFLGKMALSKELLIGLSDHVATLLPLYESAKKEYNWSRFAGMVVRSDQPEYKHELDIQVKRKYNDLKGCLHFTGEVLKSMLGSRYCLGDLVRFSRTSRFMFDSLYDIVFILRHSVNKLLFDKDGPLGTRARSLLNDLVDREKQEGHYFDAWGYLLVESCSAGSRFLRKSKYDQLRSEVLSMMVQQQHLADLYADFYEFYAQQKQLRGAPSGKDEDIERHTTRFVTINELCYQLYMVTNIIFDCSLRPVATLTLLRHVSQLKVDLDVAQEYYNISSKMLKGRYKSPEQTRSIAWWSFGLGECSYSVNCFLLLWFLQLTQLLLTTTNELFSIPFYKYLLQWFNHQNLLVINNAPQCSMILFDKSQLFKQWHLFFSKDLL